MVHHHRHAAPPGDGGVSPSTAQRALTAAVRRRVILFCSFAAFLVVGVVGYSRLFTQVVAEPPQGTAAARPCAAAGNETICCDRTSPRGDVCVMRGDIRASRDAMTFFLVSTTGGGQGRFRGMIDESVRPYTRKWENNTMSTIDELRLRTATAADDEPLACDVVHHVPAIVFSTGGYTGNVYHEFNDGIIPLYITSHHLNRQVVFVILEYHEWWMMKYHDIVAELSDHPPIDFANDRRTHCFADVTVGLRIHDELTIDPAEMEQPHRKTIHDFRQFLDAAFRRRVSDIVHLEPPLALAADEKKPKLVFMSRNGSRAVVNERELVDMATAAGFEVDVLQPRRDLELARIYMALNACDAMVGVHGAAMTHLLFMRPGAAFIQIVPIGTDWAAERFYGEPARRLGLWYVPYKISPSESSLASEFGEDGTVVSDPEKVNALGWQMTKKVYLEGQTVTLDLARFGKLLERVRWRWGVARTRMTTAAASTKRSSGSQSSEGAMRT